jgi:hypothetical protein
MVIAAEQASPVFSVDYLRNMAIGNAKLAANVQLTDATARIPISNLSSGLTIKLPAIVLAVKPVKHVLLMGAFIKMGRVDTSAIVAVVANIQTRCKATVSKKPGNTMGFPDSSIESKLAITQPAPRTEPRPAVACLVNLSPKSLCNRAIGCIAALTRTITSPSSSIIGMGQECNTTVIADERDTRRVECAEVLKHGIVALHRKLTPFRCHAPGCYNSVGAL